MAQHCHTLTLPRKQVRSLSSALLGSMIACLALLCFAQDGHSAQVTLAWDANTQPGITGYKIYYGTASGNYTSTLDVGNVTTYTVTGLNSVTNYCFAATCYNDYRTESGYSNEVCTTTSVSTLYLSHIGTDMKLYYGQWNHDGVSFTDDRIPGGGKSTHAPAMAVYQGRQYIAVKGATTNNVYIKSGTGGTSFADSSWTQLTGQTSTSPALISYNNRLYLFVKGHTSDEIYYCYMSSFGTWSSWSAVSGSSTLHKPALVVFNGRLYLFVTGDTNRIHYDSMDYAGTWSGWSRLPTGLSDQAPAVVNYNGGILLFVKGRDNHPWYTGTSTPDNPSSWVSWRQLDGLTAATPSVAVVPETNQLHVAVAGASFSGIFYRYYNPSTLTWSDWERMMGLDQDAYTEDTPALNAY
jgi:hypothetical protein